MKYRLWWCPEFPTNKLMYGGEVSGDTFDLLKDSMREGLWNPIFAERKDVGDPFRGFRNWAVVGARRTRIAVQFGWEEVPVLLCSHELDWVPEGGEELPLDVDIVGRLFKEGTVAKIEFGADTMVLEMVKSKFT